MGQPHYKTGVKDLPYVATLRSYVRIVTGVYILKIFFCTTTAAYLSHLHIWLIDSQQIHTTHNITHTCVVCVYVYYFTHA